jgi:hypothetical protein
VLDRWYEIEEQLEADVRELRETHPGRELPDDQGDRRGYLPALGVGWLALYGEAVASSSAPGTRTRRPRISPFGVKSEPPCPISASDWGCPGGPNLLRQARRCAGPSREDLAGAPPHPGATQGPKLAPLVEARFQPIKLASSKEKVPRV